MTIKVSFIQELFSLKKTRHRAASTDTFAPLQERATKVKQQLIHELLGRYQQMSAQVLAINKLTAQ
jgi:hypothetical protein